MWCFYLIWRWKGKLLALQYYLYYSAAKSLRLPHFLKSVEPYCSQVTGQSVHVYFLDISHGNKKYLPVYD